MREETVAAGTVGAINIELAVTEPMEVVVETLTGRGVEFTGPIKNYDAVRIASFCDPDRNVIVLGQVLHS